MAEEKIEMRPEEQQRRTKSSDRPTEVKIPQLLFRVYSHFKGTDDRTKEENQRFAGRFFQFSTFGNNFEVRVPDNEMWSKPPKIDQSVWVVGKLSTNNRLRISLDAKTVLAPNAENPSPSLDEMSEGASFTGVAKLIKSSYVDTSGNPNYMLRIMSDGFLYAYRIDADFFEQLPDQVIARIGGVVRPADIYRSELQGRYVGYELDITSWKPVK